MAVIAAAVATQILTQRRESEREMLRPPNTYIQWFLFWKDMDEILRLSSKCRNILHETYYVIWTVL